MIQARKLEIDISDELAEFLPADHLGVQRHLKRLLLVDLVRQETISYGKAAEIMGEDKMTFITKMGELKIPYYEGDIAEVLSDVAIISRTKKNGSL